MVHAKNAVIRLRGLLNNDSDTLMKSLWNQKNLLPYTNGIVWLKVEFLIISGLVPED